ncbi:GNAT family N-acetyltransferase [Kribbella sp. VKM Ac-2568]|uniref:GNAT family N-acetyltransferase n=1 Tax=Kribbella sp. VKM Ac-2568 TaxID=2512219 RepID=UPI00104B00C2|nr:GNAT family N-acetyltransferase [Kribbella sp. VKM Ac-2568]
MDALKVLQLEAETIWPPVEDGLGAGGLGDDTIAVTAVTYDGQSITIAGATPLSPDTAVGASLARCWLLERTTSCAAPPGLRLVSTAGSYQPPSRWSTTEWDSLMNGDQGPWVALVHGDRVQSLAHCARLTKRAAEVGVQTEDEARGRGLASVTVSAWAELMRQRDLVLFYSALEANQSSHRVAAKCHATPLGRLSRVFVQPSFEEPG